MVDKVKLSVEEERSQRELFWYREELFKCISGQWREAGGSRTGALSLRRQRMTLPMLETLRIEQATVQMSIFQYDDEDLSTRRELPRRGGKVFVRPNEFMYLRCQVSNTSGSFEHFFRFVAAYEPL